jgi:CRISPR-associated endoribonuclease Cas6
MEQLDPEYATYLHRQVRHPYALSVERAGADSLVWRVNALNKEAVDNIIRPLSLCLESGPIELRSAEVGVLQPSGVLLSETDPGLWVTRFYSDNPPRKFRLSFMSPTAFRTAGAYTFTPDLRLIFQSLQMRYSLLSDRVDEPDDELIEELTRHSRITAYSLRTLPFAVGANRVPGFIGWASVQLGGPSTLVSFAQLLFSLAEFSGVGIKTSMGMGACRAVAAALPELKTGDDQDASEVAELQSEVG